MPGLQKIIFDNPDNDTFGCLIQNPDTYGEIANLKDLININMDTKPTYQQVHALMRKNYFDTGPRQK